MPELPEVETVRSGLDRLIIGRVIADVSHDWPKSFPNAANDVQQFLVGARVTAIRRRAKVLLIDLSSDYTLVTHLKMTGQLVYIKEGLTPPLASEMNSEVALHPLKLAHGARTTQKGVVATQASEKSASLRFGAGHPTVV